MGAAAEELDEIDPGPKSHTPPDRSNKLMKVGKKENQGVRFGGGEDTDRENGSDYLTKRTKTAHKTHAQAAEVESQMKEEEKDNEIERIDPSNLTVYSIKMTKKGSCELEWHKRFGGGESTDRENGSD